jgi:alpha-D-ribose 1-methylphosphonate 5-triphosphate synthase subunit PhnH
MDPLFLSQSVSRDLLDVMSRPGSVRCLTADFRHVWPSGLLAVAATLLDQEVGFCVLDDSDDKDDSGMRQAIEEVTGGRSVNLANADFIFVANGDSRGLIRHAQRGSQDYPDLGATIIYQIERLEEDAGHGGISLRGPGIEDRATPLIIGLGPEELALIQEMNNEYPLGVDVLLIDRENKVMALPRSLRITSEKEA